MRVRGNSHQTAALGGNSDILQGKIKAETLEKLTRSMDARIVKLLLNKGSYVGMQFNLLRYV